MRVSVCLLLLGVGLAAAAVPLYSSSADKATLTACVFDYAPMSYCEGLLPPQYTGYAVELFRATAARLGWTADLLDWRCLPLREMVPSLANGSCDAGVGLRQVAGNPNTAALAYGSLTYEGGLKVLTTVSRGGAGMWSWTGAFTWQLWLATGGTMLAVGVLAWAVELSTRNLEPGAGPFQETMWYAIGYPLYASWLEPVSNAGWVLYTGFAFWALILNTMFLGNTSSILTTAQLTTGVTGVADLAGKRVAVPGGGSTYGELSAKLRKRGVQVAMELPFSTPEEREQALEVLRSGEADAIVADNAWVEHVDIANCDLMAVGDQFDSLSQATAFAPGANATELQERVDAYNAALMQLRDAGTLQLLQDEFMHLDPPACDTQDASSTQVTFSQVAGVWIILGACVGASLLLVAFHLWRHRWRANAAARLGRWGWARRHLPRALWDAAPPGASRRSSLIEKAGSKLMDLTEPASSQRLPTLEPSDRSAAALYRGSGSLDGSGSGKGGDGGAAAGGEPGGVQQQLAALAAAVAALAAEQRRLAALLEGSLAA